MCENVKPLEDFVKSRSMPLGRGYKCRSCHASARSDFRKANPNKVKEQQAAYYQRNKQKVIDASKKAAWNLRMAMIEKLGGKCSQCGIADPRALQLNHINGGGRDEYAGLAPTTLWRAIVKGERRTDDLEILCANHNQIYEYEVGRRWWPGVEE